MNVLDRIKRASHAKLPGPLSHIEMRALIKVPNRPTAMDIRTTFGIAFKLLAEDLTGIWMDAIRVSASKLYVWALV
jgi:hypothetical protein